MRTCKNHAPPNRQFPCKGGSTLKDPLQSNDQFINPTGQIALTCEACRVYGNALKKKKKRIKETAFNLQFVSKGHRKWFKKLINETPFKSDITHK